MSDLTSMSSPTLGIAGANGRMGRAIGKLAYDTHWQILTALTQPDHEDVSRDFGLLCGLNATGLAISGNHQDLLRADVVIDFSSAEAAARHAGLLAAQGGKAMVIGATGFTAAQEAEIATAAQSMPIVKSGNMSLGIAVLAHLVAQATSLLGDDWDIELVEAHHRRKLDAPSGTALMLGEAAARGRGARLADLRTPPYETQTEARRIGTIGMSVIRGGGIIGEHEVILASDEETLVLRHSARDRSLFARGALRAAKWVHQQPPGLYDMNHVLGF